MAVLTALSFGCARRSAATSFPEGPPASTAPSVSAAFDEGQASWYGDPYHGRRAASGEVFDKNKMTAAHRTLPFGTWVRVENQLNQRHVDVRINDRGPFVAGRIIDLSERAADELGMIRSGVAPVRLSVIRESDPPGVPLVVSFTPQPEDVFYVVQLGAFRVQDNARKLVERLEDKYTGIYVEQPSEGSSLYRVLIGRAVLSDARYVQNMLRGEDGIEAIVQQVTGEE